MKPIIRAYDKDTQKFIENIQIDNNSNPFPTIDGYYKDPRFEINLGSTLLDKDGQIIFENDIVEIDELWKPKTNIRRYKVLVQFVDGSFKVNSTLNPEKADTLLYIIANHSKIIGNKYQNYNLVELTINAEKSRKKRKIKSRSKSKTKKTVSK